MSISILSTYVNSQYINAQYFGRSPNILVNFIKQDPDPVEPGKQVEVSFKLDNNGTLASNFVLEIIPEYPFSLLPDESASTFIGSLGTSQDERQTVIVKYKLKVAQDAVDNNHKIKVRYKNDDINGWVTLDNFFIKVQSRDAILSVEKFFTTPEVTAPGDRTKLKIELKNYATSFLKNVKVMLNLGNNGGTTTPFSPIGSTNEKIIPYIEPLASVPIEFNLLVDSDAATKAYKISLELDYSDVLNKNYSKINLISIVVGNAPDLGVTLERTEIYTSDSAGSVVLRLVNKGAVDIKFLNVKVFNNDNVNVIGANEVYIGKLDSDDFSTAEFKLFIKGQNIVKIPVEVAYKDGNGNNYKEKREVELRLYSNSEAKNLGVKTSSYFWWIVIAIIAVIAAYYYYRKRKSRK